MRRYVVLLADGAGDLAGPTERAQHSSLDAHEAFRRHVERHGRRLSSATLAAADTATTVHPGPATAGTVRDGPLEGANEVGGYYDVELPDLDAAIAAVLLLPATCAVEIRPVVADVGHDPA